MEQRTAVLTKKKQEKTIYNDVETPMKSILHDLKHKKGINLSKTDLVTQARLSLEDAKKGRIIRRMQKEDQEEKGWLKLREKSMEELWNNPKDKRIWKKYL